MSQAALVQRSTWSVSGQTLEFWSWSPGLINFLLLLSGINVIFNLAQMCTALFQYGGELYFSDVYANLEVPEDIKSHKVLWGMCSCFFPIIDYWLVSSSILQGSCGETTGWESKWSVARRVYSFSATQKQYEGWWDSSVGEGACGSGLAIWVWFLELM